MTDSQQDANLRDYTPSTMLTKDWPSLDTHVNKRAQGVIHSGSEASHPRRAHRQPHDDGHRAYGVMR
jgi:hypothetical protein